jgi:predicted O-methyltransferase YrrM
VNDLESYVNKTVDFKFNGAELRFDLSHALFSSFAIDAGTRLLLKAVARDPVLGTAKRILDEGCGVGVIGLCMAKAFPEAEVLLRDRDSLAVAFSERNRLFNKLRGTTAWTDPDTGTSRSTRPAPRVEWGLLADGREDSRSASDNSCGYDFVLSNLPAKAGAPVLASFFARLSGISGRLSGISGGLSGRIGEGRGGPALLVPGGRAGVVIVKPLADAALVWIADAGLTVVGEARGSGHNVYIVERSHVDAGAEPMNPAESTIPAEPSALASPNLEAYIRGESRFKLADFAYRAHGFWGLPEFDTPGFGSSVAAEVLSRVYAAGKPTLSCADALVIEPGVGHLALWIGRELAPKRLTAASRDALALEATKLNLSALPARSRPVYAAVDALDTAALPLASFDLVAESPDIVPERDWIGSAWARAGSLVKSGGVYLVVCPPTEMTRLEKRKPTGALRWSLLSQRRKKGFIATAWRLG